MRQAGGTSSSAPAPFVTSMATMMMRRPALRTLAVCALPMPPTAAHGAENVALVVVVEVPSLGKEMGAAAAELHPEEWRLLSTRGWDWERRGCEFVAGRVALRRACVLAGLPSPPDGPILFEGSGDPSADGVATSGPPAFPPNAGVGSASITHRGSCAAAVVLPHTVPRSASGSAAAATPAVAAAADAVGAAALKMSRQRYVGVDLVERAASPRQQLTAERFAQRILTDAERSAMHVNADADCRISAVAMTSLSLRFSAKEAVFKAIYPHVRRHVSFKEVEVWPSFDGRIAVTGLAVEAGNEAQTEEQKDNTAVVTARWIEWGDFFLTLAVADFGKT